MSQSFKLKNGTVLLSTEVPGGVYNSVQLKKIAELCSKELAVVKATEDQRLALFVKESEVQKVAEELRAIGLGFRNYQSGLHQPVTCLGELCSEHDQPALVSAMDVTRQIENLRLDSPIKIGINGCARCCTPCHTLDISVVGQASGYRISLGGRNTQYPELSTFFAEGVPAAELPLLLKKVIVLFKEKAEPGESLGMVLDRGGFADFIEVLKPYSQDAANREDPFEGGIDTVPSLMPPETFEEVPEETSDFPLVEESSEVVQEDPGLSVPHPLEDTAGEQAQQEAVGEEAFGWDEPSELDEIPIHTDHEGSLSEDVHVSSQKWSDDLDDHVSMHDEPLEQHVDADLSTESVVESDVGLANEEVGEQLANDSEETPSPNGDDDLDLKLVEQSLEQLDDEKNPESHEDGLSSELELSREEYENSLSSHPGIDQVAFQGDLKSSEDNSPEMFGVDDFLLEDRQSLSDEDETAFEERLEESIAEESILQAQADLDLNSPERQEALELLEKTENTLELSEDSFDEIPFEEFLDDSAIEEIDIVTDETKSREDLGPKLGATTPGHTFRLAAVTFEGKAIRLGFESGAYVDFQLENLRDGEEKSCVIGQQKVTIFQEVGGYRLETDGIKMFYPKGIMAA